MHESEDPAAEITLGFKECFKEGSEVCFVYIRAADLVFSRKDVENYEEDTKENDLRTELTIQLLSILDKLAAGEGRKTMMIMSLSEKYSKEKYDELKGIPFFFASERIHKIISV